MLVCEADARLHRGVSIYRWGAEDEKGSQPAVGDRDSGLFSVCAHSGPPQLHSGHEGSWVSTGRWP